MSEQPFTWEGEAMETYGHVSHAMWRIVAIEDEEERQRTADTFMALYREQTEHADANVGYLAGYAGHDKMVAALRLFRTSHPVFGPPALADKVTPEGAFASGQAIGEQLKAQN